MYVVKNEGSWVLFTKSNYLLNRALLNRGLGVLLKTKLTFPLFFTFFRTHCTSSQKGKERAFSEKTTPKKQATRTRQ